MATTLPLGLPTKFSVTCVGVRILPTLPSVPPPCCVGVDSSCAVLQAQHRPVVGRLVALVLAGGVAVGEVVVVGEGVVRLVADVVVHVVRAVGSHRGRR